MSKFMKLFPGNFITKSKVKKLPSTSNDELEALSIPTTTYPLLSMYSISQFNIPTILDNTSSFLLVWLDATIDETNNNDSRNTLTVLRKIINPVYTFTHINYCLHFLKNIQNEKIFMIVSGSLGQIIMPMMHDIYQLKTIYIFCNDKSKHEQWVKTWSKIQGVFNEILPICHELRNLTQQCDRDSIPISIVSMNDKTSTTELNQLDQSFMYTQILKEILFDIHFDKKSIKDFTNYCRNEVATNETDLKIIDKFEREYYQHNSIWWYSNECFLHRMLNQALRMMEIDIIIKVGFFVCHLHHEIEKLHKQQYKNFNENFLIVYRGQSLSKLDFDKIIKTKGGLLSFNNFLSTSRKESIALLYAHRAMKDTNLMGIVFKITINPSISSTPFALINDVSFYKSAEQEILFSMHSIFRIDEIHQIEDNNDRLWEIQLTFTNDNDQHLNELTQCIRKEVLELKDRFRIAQLFIRLGQFDKAKDLYKELLNEKSHKNNRGYIYHQLGWIEVNLGNYQEAILFFKESLIIAARNLPPIHPDLATCYDNIGLVYDHMGEYQNALISHEKALVIYRLTLSPDHPDLATSLSNIGLVYYKLGNYSKALSYHKEAFEIYHKTLPSNHLSLAVSYNNIGLVHDNMNDYTKALWFYDKTLEICRKTLPSDHPDLAILHQNIGKALEKMCEYPKSLSSFIKALTIFQKTFPSDHPHLITCYTHIGSIYNSMNDFTQALSYYQKVLDIRQKILPSHHPDFLILYNTMGNLYDQIKQYSQALLFYQIASDICQTNFPLDQTLLTSIDQKIAQMHYCIDCYNETFPSIEQNTVSHTNTDLETSIIKTAL